MSSSSAPPGRGHELDADLVEAFLTASRVLVAVAARSLVAGNAEITLPQHRALVLLASRGPQRITDLADLLGVNSSTATRHCDRLQRREISAIQHAMPGRSRGPLPAALRGFAGAVPEQSWSLGWGTDDPTAITSTPTRQGAPR